MSMYGFSDVESFVYDSGSEADSAGSPLPADVAATHGDYDEEDQFTPYIEVIAALEAKIGKLSALLRENTVEIERLHVTIQEQYEALEERCKCSAHRVEDAEDAELATASPVDSPPDLVLQAPATAERASLVEGAAPTEDGDVLDIVREFQQVHLTEPILTHEDYADEFARIVVHLVCDGYVRL